MKKKISDKIKKLFQTGFIKSASILAGGTALSQLTLILATPFLTRIYSPENFSTLALYTSIIGIASVAACLRFEIAIPLPKDDKKAAHLLTLSLFSATTWSLLILIAIKCFPEKITTFFSHTDLKLYLWTIPISVFLVSTYAALQFWAIRKKRFKTIAKTRLQQGIGCTGAQLSIGLLQTGALGLLLGQIINSGSGILSLIRDLIKNDRTDFKNVKIKDLKETYEEYKRFPKYSTLESLANISAIQLPVFIIATFASGSEAGFFMLASRVMTAPLALIGSAISQVYLSRAPDELQKGTLNIFTKKIIIGLIKSGVGPIIFLGIVSPFVFSLVFGNNWSRAGTIVAWLSPWYVMQFIASPISMLLHVTENQKIALKLQISGLILRTSATVATALLTPELLIEIYAISGFIFYSAYFLVIAKASNLNTSDYKEIIGSSFKIILSWIATGISTSAIVYYFVIY